MAISNRIFVKTSQSINGVSFAIPFHDERLCSFEVQYPAFFKIFNMLLVSSAAVGRRHVSQFSHFATKRVLHVSLFVHVPVNCTIP